VSYQPSPQLLSYDSLTGHREFGCPLSVDPDAKTATVCKRKVDQFHFEVVSGKMILNEHTVVRFGDEALSLYFSKSLLTRQMSILSVFLTMLAHAYRARLIL
jgi:hypothetical protein